ncbi:uncharacterized protein Asciz [Venturia canescens]|uniref:uncharacterized protein Asciz n=1 Tax=Venturia canescens TaxID=32260 RepID=UPI001C9CF156|nr:uncharacterized protein LOC122418057 [Venturia canescens]
MEEINNENSKDIKIVCPKAEELSVIVNKVRCEECGLTFSNEPRLRMHVLKIHEHKNLIKNIKEDVRYHCPENTCVYALTSQRFFTTMKYLKQHYLKVHAAKKFGCDQCDKSFSTEAARIAHSRVCGVEFTCGCLRVFGTYEALLTHCKRASHTVDQKYKKAVNRKPQGKSSQPTKPVSISSSQSLSKPVMILPLRTSYFMPANTAKISFDVAVQTDDLKRQKRTQSPSKSCKRRESRQTQTQILSKEKRLRKTVETQTTRNSLKPAVRRKHSKVDLTLPENFATDNLFSPSTLELGDEVALEDLWGEKNASLGTQTSPDKDLLEALSDSVTQTDLVTFYTPDQGNCLNIVENSCYSYEDNTRGISSRSDPMLTIDSFTDRFSSIETQTETISSNSTPLISSSDSFFENELVASRNFALSSNNETQTTENFHNIEQLLYSNNYTQTCNDILRASDLGLSDIQTQTAWPELVHDSNSISAKTQTRTTQAPNLQSGVSNSSEKSWLNTRISHTETQTDLLSIFDEFP